VSGHVFTAFFKKTPGFVDMVVVLSGYLDLASGDYNADIYPKCQSPLEADQQIQYDFLKPSSKRIGCR